KLHEEESGIVRIPLGRGREEEQPRLVTNQVALDRQKERHPLAIVIHRHLRARVGFFENPVRRGSGARDLGEGDPRTFLWPCGFDPHAQPQRREVQIVNAILHVDVSEDHRLPQTPKPFRNCSAISPSSTCENVSKSDTAEYSASCSSREMFGIADATVSSDRMNFSAACESVIPLPS